MATVRTSAERTGFTPIATIAATLRALHRLASGLTAWRERRRSIGHLRSMSDAQLRDIGVTRVQIERLARGAANDARRDAA